MATDVYLEGNLAHAGGDPLSHDVRLKPEVYRKLYSDFAEQNPKWNEIPSSTGEVYEWDRKSTYIQEPPFFVGFGMEPGHISEIKGARPLGIFGDSVTTDHISPAGAIKKTSPAGKFLLETRRARRRISTATAHAEATIAIMTRGTFANVRIKNLMVPGVEGGYTLYFGQREVPAPDKEIKASGWKADVYLRRLHGLQG